MPYRMQETKLAKTKKTENPRKSAKPTHPTELLATQISLPFLALPPAVATRPCRSPPSRSAHRSALRAKLSQRFAPPRAAGSASPSSGAAAPRDGSAAARDSREHRSPRGWGAGGLVFGMMIRFDELMIQPTG